MSSFKPRPDLLSMSQISDALEKVADSIAPLSLRGRVVEVIGTLVRATGLEVSLGEVVELHSRDQPLPLLAEVVGFGKEGALLSPYGSMAGISAKTTVVATGRPHQVPVGEALLGRILNGFGDPIDGGPPIETGLFASVYRSPPNPMKRKLIHEPMSTGVRVIDGMITFGIGQRVGVFAAAGVGKSTLMGMLARGARSDINVIGLIGERGREVREFIEESLGEEGLRRSVLVVATSDRSSIERAKAAYVTTAIAEYFRDQGSSVFLMMDSLTRFARAMREIGLACGEPPTRRGFPPSIFAELPRLVERAGQSDVGSITALYTVLAEGESTDDPIAEEARSLLDGHIVMSRKMAAKNHYPAIDMLGSASRVMHLVTSKEHRQAAARFRNLLSKYNEIETLLQVGEYKAGGDPVADEAVKKINLLRQFLQQPTDHIHDYKQTLTQLSSL
jgi:ATP synthase in type III secretion protein N